MIKYGYICFENRHIHINERHETNKPFRHEACTEIQASRIICVIQHEERHIQLYNTVY